MDFISFVAEHTTKVPPRVKLHGNKNLTLALNLNAASEVWTKATSDTTLVKF